MTGAELDRRHYGLEDLVLVPRGFDLGERCGESVGDDLTFERTRDAVAQQQVPDDVLVVRAFDMKA